MPRLAKPMLFASAEECEQAFYEALESADADAVTDLWLDEAEVCCVHPNGPRLIGHTAVIASWRAILDNGPVRIRAIARRSVEGPTLTMSNVIEELVVVQGRTQKVVQVIATNMYIKTPAGWKMVLHHASPAPEGEAADVEVPTGPLH